MKIATTFFITFWLSFVCITLPAQDIYIHSHNDYRQIVPFYQAYAQQLSSIEADIFSTGTEGELLVAHDSKELAEAPSLEDTYIKPLVSLFAQHKGTAWKQSEKSLILLVDLKTPADPTLNYLVDKLKAYPEVFDPSINTHAVRVVISGNRPHPDQFRSFPPIISFDGEHTNYTPEQLQRISMISLNFRDYSNWNGKGRMLEEELQKVKQAIADVHRLGKPIRFWGTPDGVTAWYTFHTLGVDYINTDQPEACAAFFHDFHKKTYSLGKRETGTNDVALAKRLDRTTAGFQGFQNKELQLSKGIDIYTPAYKNDGKDKPVKNVILLIGDGMGLAQICAADAINQGLSMLLLNHTGFQKTQAADSYTTDSAAAGSALATGKKHHNRHISMSPDGKIYPSLTDIFHRNNYACGVLSLGNLSDATPAAFYGHSVERDNSDEITAWLTDGKLSVLAGSGMEVFTQRNDGRDLLKELKEQQGYHICTNILDINRDKGKVICVDERMGKSATENSLNLLAETTRQAIQKLTEEKGKKGFFLMVEGAKIDYAGHANSLPGSILETLSFDLAVAEALKFADSNGETLVIVTADHETGGLSLVDGNTENHSITIQYTTDDHTPIMLPVFSYGPQADKFTGVYENTEIFPKIINAIKVKL